ncbi:bactofilin family protein [Flavobacterium agrisoli]|uniref:Polymer-forming cytoskeletal protein n=1 Tax=Flavobacterium agrisoli TaxID=2793066 RepID=A0A934UJI0_9FLAO|nr:polymer-forming cytoskeletal protein [Flavobacterium agrisoli]MBK0369599.1 polymer-forming cytoskeletal protein [Flavobacterium agrisoli]
MFQKSPKPSTDVLGKTNRIVEGTVITGDIVSQADFRLDGELIGNFTSSGKIVIGQKGKVKGDISCQNADVEGEFAGTLKVEETLNVKQTARIEGEVITGKLSVEPGAKFTATCKMLREVKEDPKNNGTKPKPKEA